MLNTLPLFDSHLHIIDQRFPLVTNQGYLPTEFTVQNYLSRLSHYNLCGGVVVSGSFQAFDQTYLEAALTTLGANFVGITQLPSTVSVTDIQRLHRLGVRGVRFNLARGGSETLSALTTMAKRIYDIAQWHVELYIQPQTLIDIANTIKQLPRVSIDHLGLSEDSLSTLLPLVEQGVKVKASGFSRIQGNYQSILQHLYTANPKALMFGTDLPSTRAPRAYSDHDYQQVIAILGEQGAKSILSENAINFYRPSGYFTRD